MLTVDSCDCDPASVPEPEECGGGCESWTCGLNGCGNDGACLPPLPPPCVTDGLCDGVCPSGCSQENVDEDPDCGCRDGDGCCGVGCDSWSDQDCGTCVTDGSCDGICPDGCTLNDDPDCGCKNNNDCCGVINCTSVNDNDCGNGNGFTWTGEITNPLNYDDFKSLLGAVAGFIFDIAMVVAPLMLIIAGLLYVTSGGDPARAGTAKKMILYTLIGLALVLLASGLIAVLKSILGAKEEAFILLTYLT